MITAAMKQHCTLGYLIGHGLTHEQLLEQHSRQPLLRAHYQRSRRAKCIHTAAMALHATLMILL
jgi:hypothetical protein